MSFKSERTVRGRILSVLQKNEKLATEAAEKEFARAYAPVAAGVAAVTTCVTCVCVCESVCVALTTEAANKEFARLFFCCWNYDMI